MKVYLALTLVGPFLLDTEGNVIGVRFFNKSPTEASQKITQIDQGSLPTEVKDILNEVKKEEIFTNKASLGNLISKEGFKIVSNYENPVIDTFYHGIERYLIDTNIFKNDQEYFDFIRKTTLLITRERVRQAAEKRDRLVVHAIETIDDMDKTLNLFSGRLREFYGMHFPELADAIDNHYTYAMIVSKIGIKENLSKELLVNDLKLPEQKAKDLIESREKSMGSDLIAQDIDIIREQAKLIVDLFERKIHLEKWMDETMKAIAPNICGVTNALIGARLIALAGSLRGLALCPSSKLQVLGAEKALYRTIKTGAPPPKHGVIYQDPRINQAKWWQRGKIARVISGRISIAARMDFFEAEDKSEDFLRELNQRIDEIRTKYPEPSEKTKPSTTQKKPQPSFQKQDRGGQKPRYVKKDQKHQRKK